MYLLVRPTENLGIDSILVSFPSLFGFIDQSVFKSLSLHIAIEWTVPDKKTNLNTKNMIYTNGKSFEKSTYSFTTEIKQEEKEYLKSNIIMLLAQT